MKNNELKRIKIEIDESGLGRVYSTLDISTILVGFLADLWGNFNREPNKSEGDRLLYYGNSVGIAVSDISKYFQVLSDVLRGEGFDINNIDVVRLFFMNKNTNILLYDRGQTLQKGEVAFQTYNLGSYDQWVWISFNDESFMKQVKNFMMNQFRLATIFTRPNLDFYIQPEHSLESLLPEDFYDQEKSIMSGNEIATTDNENDMIMNLEDIQFPNDKSCIFHPIGKGIVYVGKTDKGLALRQLSFTRSNPDMSLVPVYNGVAYSSTEGNCFFYQTDSINKVNGMITFDMKEAKKIYSEFLENIAGVIKNIDKNIENSIGKLDFKDILYYFIESMQAFTETPGLFSRLLNELKKLGNLEIPYVNMCLKFVALPREITTEDVVSNDIRWQIGVIGDGVYVIDNKIYRISQDITPQGDYRMRFENTSNYKNVPSVPEFRHKIWMIGGLFEPNNRNNALLFLMPVSAKLYEFLRRNKGVTIYTSPKDGKQVGISEHVSKGDVYIKLPNNVLATGQGKAIIIGYLQNLINRMMDKGLIDRSFEVFNINLLNPNVDEHENTIYFEDIVEKYAIIFKDKVPYRVPLDEVKKYGVKKLTQRLDIALIYPDTALVDPLFFIGKNKFHFSSSKTPVWNYKIEAYDGLFLLLGGENE
ncbi:MAG: hypothetical protein QW292_02940 [Candidatus Parvarchaeota archaeon]